MHKAQKHWTLVNHYFPDMTKNSDSDGPSVSYSGASTTIIYVTRICCLFCNQSMLISIDIIFYGPQIRVTYIMIVEAPL
jgi:hypothetical protein